MIDRGHVCRGGAVQAIQAFTLGWMAGRVRKPWLDPPNPTNPTILLIHNKKKEYPPPIYLLSGKESFLKFVGLPGLVGFAAEIRRFFTPLGWIQIQVKPQRPRLKQNAAAPPQPNTVGIPNLHNDALQHGGGKGTRHRQA